MTIIRLFQTIGRQRVRPEPHGDLVFVPTDLIAQCKTFRDACRLAWDWRRVENLTKLGLAERCGLRACFVTDYFNEEANDRKGRRRRELPPDKIDVVEEELGNNAISQYLNRKKGFRIWEEVKALADRMVAA
ncbi:XRE family transcriptional regulator [Burkholderia sp. Ax-1724]|uniref:XRE family transcriptional regulator n=1 Tax=Burkholderia sp. Ax-1724 TaxID=2608336 RepID=UPI0014200556|nr:XRE family transcriptional regulator [Burkholderia sp. Ax-1724]NIF51428.1 XRE family transcriptional regulator [Burkholderia sp. Ax-1724]